MLFTALVILFLAFALVVAILLDLDDIADTLLNCICEFCPDNGAA